MLKNDVTKSNTKLEKRTIFVTVSTSEVRGETFAKISYRTRYRAKFLDTKICMLHLLYKCMCRR